MSEYQPKDTNIKSDERYKGSLNGLYEGTADLGSVRKNYQKLNEELREKGKVKKGSILPHEQGRN